MWTPSEETTLFSLSIAWLGLMSQTPSKKITIVQLTWCRTRAYVTQHVHTQKLGSPNHGMTSRCIVPILFHPSLWKGMLEPYSDKQRSCIERIGPIKDVLLRWWGVELIKSYGMEQRYVSVVSGRWLKRHMQFNLCIWRTDIGPSIIRLCFELSSSLIDV